MKNDVPSRAAPAHVLLVEDDEHDATLVRSLLGEVAPDAYRLTHVTGVPEALGAIQKMTFDVCVVDERLGDAPGLALLARLRTADDAVPSIFLTAENSLDLDLEAMRRGAVDYLCKAQLSAELLERSLRYAIRRGQRERALARAARRDALTCLHNRTSLLEGLQSRIERHGETGTAFAVLAIDLNRFKAINDALGHQAGDLVIRTVADRLKRAVRPQDLVARVGGDEFVIVLDDLGPASAGSGHDGRAWISKLASRVAKTVGETITMGEERMTVSASVGIARYPDDGVEADQLLKASDHAMYRSKRGRRHPCFFDAELDGECADAGPCPSTTETIEVEYQPQIDLVNGRLRACEALLSWKGPSDRPTRPKCASALRRRGLLFEASERVRTQAAAQARAWRESGLFIGRLAVNVAGSELFDPALVDRLQAIMSRHEIGFELEIRESELPEDDAKTRAAFARLRALGVRMAIDDFGSGISSLQRIRNLSFDVLKIDRSFITRLEFDDRDRAIIEGMVRLGERMGVEIVAEGVQNDSQRLTLLDLGVRYAQGPGLCPPGGVTDFEAWYEDRYPGSWTRPDRLGIAV